jgi:hypothetical protein
VVWPRVHKNGQIHFIYFSIVKKYMTETGETLSFWTHRHEDSLRKQIINRTKRSSFARSLQDGRYTKMVLDLKDKLARWFHRSILQNYSLHEEMSFPQKGWQAICQLGKVVVWSSWKNKLHFQAAVRRCRKDVLVKFLGLRVFRKARPDQQIRSRENGISGLEWSERQEPNPARRVCSPEQTRCGSGPDP